MGGPEARLVSAVLPIVVRIRPTPRGNERSGDPASPRAGTANGREAHIGSVGAVYRFRYVAMLILGGADADDPRSAIVIVRRAIASTVQSSSRFVYGLVAESLSLSIPSRRNACG